MQLPASPATVRTSTADGITTAGGGCSRLDAGAGRRTSPDGRPGAVTPGQVAEAWKDLGRDLARWRERAGLTQAELARRASYSRSGVAVAEIGRPGMSRAFWERADPAVGAGGSLLAAFDLVDALAGNLHARAAREREPQSAGQREPPTVEPDACRTCGGPVVAVGRWTGRESRALREALRMSVRGFAEHLGVSAAAVSLWEKRAGARPLRLATQAVLDQALTLADADAKARFAVLLASPPAGPSPAVTGDRGAAGPVGRDFGGKTQGLIGEDRNEAFRPAFHSRVPHERRKGDGGSGVRGAPGGWRRAAGRAGDSDRTED